MFRVFHGVVKLENFVFLAEARIEELIGKTVFDCYPFEILLKGKIGYWVPGRVHLGAIP